MQDHRIRLSDPDVALIVAALRARVHHLGADGREHAEYLIERLEQQLPGNPTMRYGLARPKRIEDYRRTNG